jgi:predicted outer membrane protein
MKKSAPFLTLVLALVCLSFAGCQQQKGASSEGDYSETQRGSDQQAQQSRTQAGGDRQFLTEAAIDGRLEVELGRLAATKASSPAVKRFAQKLVEDHSKANQQLESLPQAREVSQSASIPAEKQSIVDHLSKLSGREFDRAFAQHAVEDHEKAAALFQEAATNAQDQQVKQFAAQTLPILQEHLEMAKSLQAQLAGRGGRKGQ